MSLGTKSFATEGIHDKVHDTVHDETRFTTRFTIRFTTKDPGTKIPVPRSLGEPVLHDGGTAPSTDPNRYPFFTVRTPQASLVGEKSKMRLDVGMTLAGGASLHFGILCQTMSTLSDRNLTPLPTDPGIKYVARGPCCNESSWILERLPPAQTEVPKGSDCLV